MRRTTSRRGYGCVPDNRSEMKFLSSRSFTLKRGLCFFISSFSRRSASFSVGVMITSTSPSRSSRKGMKARASPVRSWKYWFTRARRLTALPTYTTSPALSFMRYTPGWVGSVSSLLRSSSESMGGLPADSSSAATGLLLPARHAAVLRPGRPDDTSGCARLCLERLGALGQDAEVEVLDRLDLVAEHRGALEIELVRFRPHLLLELRDHLRHVALVLRQVSGQLLLARERVVLVGGDALDGKVEDGPLHALRCDAVLLVVSELLRPAAIGLVESGAHRSGDGVRVEDHPALHVARGAADGLDERDGAAQESFLVGIEDGDERHLGDVETF